MIVDKRFSSSVILSVVSDVQEITKSGKEFFTFFIIIIIIIINFDYPGQDYAFAWQRVVTDVGLHSECLPHISRQPPLKYKVDLSP